MELIRDLRDAIVRHLQEDPSFQDALLEEAVRSFMESDLSKPPEQDPVNATGVKLA